MTIQTHSPSQLGSTSDTSSPSSSSADILSAHVSPSCSTEGVEKKQISTGVSLWASVHLDVSVYFLKVLCSYSCLETFTNFLLAVPYLCDLVLVVRDHTPPDLLLKVPGLTNVNLQGYLDLTFEEVGKYRVKVMSLMYTDVAATNGLLTSDPMCAYARPIAQDTIIICASWTPYSLGFWRTTSLAFQMRALGLWWSDIKPFREELEELPIAMYVGDVDITGDVGTRINPPSIMVEGRYATGRGLMMYKMFDFVGFSKLMPIYPLTLGEKIYIRTEDNNVNHAGYCGTPRYELDAPKVRDLFVGYFGPKVPFIHLRRFPISAVSRRFTFENISWQPDNPWAFRCTHRKGGTRSCRPTQRWYPYLQFTYSFHTLKYIGVPDVVLNATAWHSARQLSWRRLAVSDLIQRPRRTIYVSSPKLISVSISALLREDQRTLPRFALPCLQRLELVGLSGSTQRWHMDHLLCGVFLSRLKRLRLVSHNNTFSTPQLKVRSIDFISIAPHLEILSIHGYVPEFLNTFDVNLRAAALFTSLKRLSIDAVRLPWSRPRSIGHVEHDVLHIKVVKERFPALQSFSILARIEDMQASLGRRTRGTLVKTCIPATVAVVRVGILISPDICLINDCLFTSKTLGKRERKYEAAHVWKLCESGMRFRYHGIKSLDGSSDPADIFETSRVSDVEVSFQT